MACPKWRSTLTGTGSTAGQTRMSGPRDTARTRICRETRTTPLGRTGSALQVRTGNTCPRGTPGTSSSPRLQSTPGRTVCTIPALPTMPCDHSYDQKTNENLSSSHITSYHLKISFCFISICFVSFRFVSFHFIPCCMSVRSRGAHHRGLGWVRARKAVRAHGALGVVRGTWRRLRSPRGTGRAHHGVARGKGARRALDRLQRPGMIIQVRTK